MASCAYRASPRSAIAELDDQTSDVVDSIANMSVRVATDLVDDFAADISNPPVCILGAPVVGTTLQLEAPRCLGPGPSPGRDCKGRRGGEYGRKTRRRRHRHTQNEPRDRRR